MGASAVAQRCPDPDTDYCQNAHAETGDSIASHAAVDADNRVKSVNSGSVTLYTYDADGRRVKKVTSAGTWYTFRDLDGNPVYEYKTGVGGGSLTYNHYFQGRLVFTNTALASPTKQWIYSDHLGSPRLRLDASGTEKSRHWYYPYGEEFQPPVNPVIFRYNANERDSETGMQDYGARYYDTLMGRFTAVDPLTASGKPDNPQSWNRYLYVVNNPLRYNDPDGRQKNDRSSDMEDVARVGQGAARATKDEVVDTVRGAVSILLVALNEVDFGRWVFKGPRPSEKAVEKMVDAAKDPMSIPSVDSVLLEKAVDTVMGVNAALKAGDAEETSYILTRTVLAAVPFVVFGTGHTISESAAKALGIERRTLGKAIEQIKDANGLPGNYNVKVDARGLVYDREGTVIGNVYDEKVKR